MAPAGMLVLLRLANLALFPPHGPALGAGYLLPKFETQRPTGLCAVQLETNGGRCNWVADRVVTVWCFFAGELLSGPRRRTIIKISRRTKDFLMTEVAYACPRRLS